MPVRIGRAEHTATGVRATAHALVRCRCSATRGGPFTVLGAIDPDVPLAIRETFAAASQTCQPTSAEELRGPSTPGRKTGSAFRPANNGK
ncbi:hypothetical protein ACFWNN_43605 [Lentzea sp. NPDC058450]|uniref:hypothetical protein n=1 Tax=Lentzea sp. NPDC058450 TaxID=3346505 RepID=UPI00364B65CB